MAYLRILFEAERGADDLVVEFRAFPCLSGLDRSLSMAALNTSDGAMS